jgi:hypothetical protein
MRRGSSSAGLHLVREVLGFVGPKKTNQREMQKQILRSAYPNFVGAPSCSAQDDTSVAIFMFAPGAAAGGFYADAIAAF